jgi:hypothetical protein
VATAGEPNGRALGVDGGQERLGAFFGIVRASDLHFTLIFY